MPIRNRRFALAVAMRSDLNFDLISGEARGDKHVFDSALFNIVGRKQPQSFPAILGSSRENRAFALAGFRRMEEMGCPTWRPFRLAHRTEERCHLRDRPF